MIGWFDATSTTWVRVPGPSSAARLPTLSVHGGRRRSSTTWPRDVDVACVDAATVEALVRHWEHGWNTLDLDTIMAPFGPEIVFSSPFVPRIGGDPSRTTVEGYDAVRRYLADSFVRATPGLRYTLDASYAGTDRVVLVYTVHRPDGTDRAGADTMRLDPVGKVVEWHSHYPFDAG